MDHDSTKAMIAQVQSILRIANDLKEATASHSSRHQSLTTKNTFPVADSINLPSPHSLLSSLLEAGASHEIATAANRIYQQRAEEFKQHIERTTAAACLGMPLSPVSSPDPLMSKVISTFTEIYLRRLAIWREEIIKRVKQAPKMPTKAASKNSRSFNHDCVPLLEHFFEENPFPTHADKVFLANKSNMEYKQIHVWFQNRRNRTKKEGKTLRKKLVYEAAVRPLHDRMKGRIESDSQVPETSKIGPERASGAEISRNDVPKDTFSSSSPPHAYPSPYPPVCHYDPFPCKSGPVRVGKSEWRRLPCGKVLLPSSTSISIDELTDKFSRLNVRDEARFKGSPKPLSDSCAATSAITVIPSSAPHPSLLRCESRQEVSIVQRYPVVRAAIPSLKAFKGCSPISKPATLVPSPVSPERTKLMGKRKTAPLPRRFPGRLCNVCRDTTPSESSSSSSPSPRLFSSDIESRNCSFSSVSSLGITSPLELPHSFGSPCYSLFDDPTYLRDIAALTVPPVS